MIRSVSSHEEHDDLGLNAVTSVGKNVPGDEVLPSQLQVMVIGNGTFATHTIHDVAKVTIGRSSACDVAVNDESISRRHAILHVGETVTIEDVGSANGTLVRGIKILPGRRVEISAGELVGIGDASILLQRRSRPLRSRRIWTHDAFEARLEDECAREERSGVAFTLFRLYPDRRAPAGFVEETLGDCLRETDILGKYGPHEYEVLLPDTPPSKAGEAVSRIEARLKERKLECRIFAACCPRDGRSPYQLIAKAQAPVLIGKAAVASPEIVVNDVQMKGLYQLVAKVAVSQIGVLLLGETGVGKEMFARAVHEASRRAGGPFVEINCAALTETLLESELFGHEKGAFTNAVTAKAGLLESAQGGTVLLDEIGDMPLATQVKLLRVIEDSQVRRVGGLKSKPIDVRFVAATNCDIEALVERGAFRRDLFFRLNGVTIVIPPLRERLAEIELLATEFIRRATTADQAQAVALSSQAIEAMKRYRWPGNIRELKNVMERAVLLCGQGPILPEHLPSEKVRMTLVHEPRGHAPSPSSPTQLTDEASDSGWAPARPREKGSKEEQQWILQALDRAGGNQTEAARQLGISRRTLVSRLNDYSFVRPRKATKKQDE